MSVFGYRAWRVLEGGVLVGLYSDKFLWSLREPNVGTCTQGHRAGSTACMCGFYSWADFGDAHDEYTDLLEYLPQARVVLGAVECFGLAEIGTRGYRSEKSAVRALVLPAPTALASTARAAGVEVLQNASKLVTRVEQLRTQRL